MDQDEKILETTVDTLATRCQDLKNSITSFIFKLETEHATMNWPSFLDNFALISGQINNLMKVIKSNRSPSFRNHILLPLLLSPERDEELVKLTEGRVQAFTHDMVPDYLRTKPDPEVEAKESQLLKKYEHITPENSTKQITSSNKIVNNLLETIKSHRESWGNDNLHSSTSLNQTSSISDTNAIIAAISLGKGIIDSVESSKTPQNNISQISNQTQATRTNNKVPSTIKTNIKSGSSSNPYSR